MASTMMKITTAVLSLVTLTTADIVFENEPIIASEVFDLKYTMNSEVPASERNTSKYYCIFRSLWNKHDHPAYFPDMARITPQVIFSHTKQYTPFLKNREANRGVEVLVEEGFTVQMNEQIQQAGEMVLDRGESKGFYLNRKHQELNYKYLPGIKMRDTHPFLSAIAAFDPSPDWFTGFYMMNTVDEYTRNYWDHFLIQTYPWDAGTDGGTVYNDTDVELEKPLKVTRFTVDTVPNRIFVSPNGNEILPTGEFECILHTCPAEVDEDNCKKPDWPPANGCDVLLYPECDNECDPKVDSPCERCQRISIMDAELLYFPDCCKAGREPKYGKSCAQRNSAAREVSGAAVALLLAIFSAAAFFS